MFSLAAGALLISSRLQSEGSVRCTATPAASKRRASSLRPAFFPSRFTPFTGALGSISAAQAAQTFWMPERCPSQRK